ncbi:hypothetical protein [Sorangium sp. So ce406]|uniref:hypothetical protein n=1 Tax=Sorangium sp. So ce406 TaxID=3133311 RepID=UPI003F5BBE69
MNNVSSGRIARGHKSDDRAKVATVASLRRAPLKKLLSLAMTGGARPLSLSAGIDAAVIELEVIYRALDAQGEQWAASALHLLQCRLRALAELARRRGATPNAAYQ